MTQAKVMIVEDEGIVALDLQNRLTQLGYLTVGRATNGEDAIRMALTLQPDLILMDVRIQGDLDGIETTARIHEHQNTPVIYLTAYANEQTLQRAKATEPYGYLIKPFEERELYTTVEVALYKHRAEQQIKRQAQQLRQILQSVPEGVLLLDPEQRIVQANAIARDHLKLLARANDGERITMLGQYSIDELAIAGAAPFWAEIEVENGPHRRIFEVNVKKVLVDEINAFNHGYSGWVIVTRDVTDAHEMRRRAQQQEQMAAIGQLAAGIAHDFNNIVAAINMAAEMIQLTQRDLTPDNFNRLNVVMRQGQRASALIKQIMDFSRRSVTERQSVDMISIMHELKGMLDHTFPETIAVDITHTDRDYFVDADPTQMVQVLMNLSLNARDAMPDGGQLEISLDQRELSGDDIPLPGMKPGAWVIVSVSDNGVGIPDEALAHVFEPFFSTKGPSKGTGLGLAQVYGIVQRHEGHIQVATRVGHGTTFTIYLPALIRRSVDQPFHSTHESETQIGLGQKILLVEDNEMLRETMAEALVMLNYDVLKASNGLEALDVLESYAEDIRLVVSDLIMPVMGGSELCQEIFQQYPGVEIILMTGYSPEEKILQLKAAGVRRWLQKPVSIQVLSECIMESLQPT